MATPVVGAQLQLALINMDENFKRRERRRAVDNGTPLVCQRPEVYIPPLPSSAVCPWGWRQIRPTRIS